MKAQSVKVMTALAILAAAMAVIGWTPPAAAQAGESATCAPKFAEAATTITLLATEIGAGRQAVGEQQIRILARAPGTPPPSEPCRATLQLSRLSGESPLPTYSLLADGRPLAPSFAEASGDLGSRLPLAFGSGASATQITLSAAAAAEWGIPAGRHSEQLQLTLLDEAGTPTDRMTLTLVHEIPRAVDLMIVGATGEGATARIDLGTLSQRETTQSAPFGVRVWSTSGYRLGIASENGGNLQHAAGMDAIPYRLMLAGSPVELGEGAHVRSVLTPSAWAGDLYRMGIIVAPRWSIAGQYSDRITISVSAL